MLSKVSYVLFCVSYCQSHIYESLLYISSLPFTKFACVNSTVEKLQYNQAIWQAFDMRKHLHWAVMVSLEIERRLTMAVDEGLKRMFDQKTAIIIAHVESREGLMDRCK